MESSLLKVRHKLSIGSWSINSADDPRTELVALETNLSLDSSVDNCRISVYTPQAEMLEQLVRATSEMLGLGGVEKVKAFSVQLGGNAIKLGDLLTIELTAGDRAGKVMSAEVQSIESTFGQTKINGATSKQTLVNARLNQVYQNQTLHQIVTDLAGQAGVATGKIDTGSTYSYLIVHEAKNLLAHISELAMRDGMDVYFDTENKLTVGKFNKSSADHTFFYGIDVLDLQLRNHQPVSERILVYGESPSSNLGGDTWHWIAKDLSPFRGEMGKGAKTMALPDGACKTKDATANLAVSKFGVIKDQSTSGKLKILGNPLMKLGDAIEIKNAPKTELNGLFKVVSVRHVLNKRDGYLTFVGFNGQGADKKTGNLMGQLGELGGALGL